MGESIGIQEYLESYVPQLVENYLELNPIPQMTGTAFTIQLTMEGARSLVYGITIRDAKKIEVTPGGIENAMVSISVPEDLIRRAVDLITPWTGRQRYDAVKDAKGALDMELEMPGDWKVPLHMVFNGAVSPRVKISLPLEDAASIATGSLNAPMAVMQGKVKLDGDMAFALSLARLLI